jgi:hypothetical protein
MATGAERGVEGRGEDLSVSGPKDTMPLSILIKNSDRERHGILQVFALLRRSFLTLSTIYLREVSLALEVWVVSAKLRAPGRIPGTSPRRKSSHAVFFRPA